LLDERGGRFGFRDLASARQFAKLLADGVSLPEIIRGVNQIRKWLPEASLANVRLHPGPQRSLEIEQAGGRTDKNGQFVLAIDGSQHSSDELFGQAQLAEETKNIAEAERLYRILMKSDPTDASAPFNLGNLLRAGARNVEAEAALRAATRADPTFAEAWYNLSDLLDEQGRSEAAIECLRTALEVAPNYADAIFQSRAAIAKKK
jgi:tetratricopeptide (TPR) repeat protein